ncbi:MAG: DUF3883 domain-containing protein [Defluviitaleaceae bacterium]|nr:DUF3883 domain-containing protein [Defluviitaleaceae bacterium]
MFFELHEERKIGYKMLSEADLGISAGNTTHIGLSERVLTFLSDKDVISEDSIFIYEDYYDYIDAYFDRIERANGSFNAPKIKSGGKDVVSVTSTIREKARSLDKNIRWFLFWFGLKNEQVVYLLLDELSNDYKNIVNLGLDLTRVSKGAKVVNSSLTKDIKDFIENKLNQNGLATFKELEIASQIGANQPIKKFGTYDIERMNVNFRKIGRAGEELINEYLEKRLHKREILHFTWYNKDRESGKPYDFTLENHNGNVVNLDVKTTKFDFSQKIIFSSQEIEFITSTHEDYNIYRVYYNIDNLPHVRICDDCKGIATQINAFTSEYRSRLDKVHTHLQSAKLAISPENECFKFKQGILL